MLDRLWYKKRARYELIVAVLSWLAAIIGGIVALINGLAGTMAAVIPALLIVTFFVVTALATTFKLVLDINKAEV